MSYEYKEKIKEDLEYSLEGVSIDYYSSEELIHKQKVKELDNVYSQAAKADEYEKSKHRTHVNDRKAEAFDAILKAYDEASSEGQMVYELSNIIEKYESGESNG